MKIVNMHKRRIPATLSTTRGIIREVKTQLESTYTTHTYTHTHENVFKLRQQHELARIAATDETRRTTPLSGLRFLAFNVFFLAIGLLRLRLQLMA